jgi:hypothetical protein
MTALLDPPRTRRAQRALETEKTPADRLRTTMGACRVAFTWWGTRRTLTAEQKAAAAEAFDAEGAFLSAAKKLLDTKHPAFRAVTAIRTKIINAWKDQTLPYPEPGVRLIKLANVEEFAAQMAEFRSQLESAVVELDQHYAELMSAARERLGSLFNPADYPGTLVGLFGVTSDFPSVEPPEYLAGLCPGLYEQEQARVRARFEQAVELAEQAFLEQFQQLIEHLCERITGAGEDGQPKVFRDSIVGNMVEFFGRFRELNVRSNEQLDALVERAQTAIRGVGAQDLRDSDSVRQHVANQLAGVRSALDGMLVDRPRRRILRQSSAAAGGS